MARRRAFVRAPCAARGPGPAPRSTVCLAFCRLAAAGAAAERVKAAAREREEGNRLFLAGKAIEAQALYDRGIVHLYFDRESWAGALSEGDREQIQGAKLPLHLNRAQCKLRQGKWTDAEWDCDCALEIDPGNAKALFRRGRARLGRLTDTVRKEERREFWDHDRAADLASQTRCDAVARTPGRSCPDVPPRPLTAQTGRASGDFERSRECGAAETAVAKSLAQVRACEVRVWKRPPCASLHTV